MPNRYQNKEREQDYKWIAERDGECCLICKKTPSQLKFPLEIDHANENPWDRSPENLHLLCKSHNNAMRHLCTQEHIDTIRAYCAMNVCVCEKQDVCDKASECPKATGCASEGERLVKSLVNYHDGSPEMNANSIMCRRYQNYVLDKVNSNGWWELKDLNACGCLAAGCNIVSGTRYLEPLISSDGPLRVKPGSLGKVVCLREPSTAKNGKRTKGRKNIVASPINKASAQGGAGSK